MPENAKAEANPPVTAVSGPAVLKEPAAQKTLKAGGTPSDAEKDANVAAGGSNGKSAPPDASGATIEVEVRQSQDMDHPAVDSQPRKGLPPVAMRIDFNDPRV